MEVITKEGLQVAFGQWLEGKLEELGWSQTKLSTRIAIATGETVTQPSISEYVRGERSPDFITMIRIGITVGEHPPQAHLIEAAKATGLYLGKHPALPTPKAKHSSRRLVSA